MNKTKKALLAQRAKLEARANAILNDETREYGPEQQKKVDELCEMIDQLNKRLDRMDDEEVDTEEQDDQNAIDNHDEDMQGDQDGDEENDAPQKKNQENARRSAPAPRGPSEVRSAGRRSAPGIIIDPNKGREFSVIRAVRDFNKRGGLTGYEAECNQEMERNSGPSSGFFRVPFGDVRKLQKREIQKRDLTLTTGAGAVPVWTSITEFVDYLYPKMVGPQLGFDYMTGLQGQTKIPRQNSVPTVTAVAEQGAATGSQPGLDYVLLNPHTIVAKVTISRKFAMQSVVAADRYVYNAGSRIIAVQADQWALTGSGTSNQPAGLVNNSALTQFVPATGTSNALTFGNSLTMQQQVATANANFGNLGWVTSPLGYANLSQQPKIGTTYPLFLIEDGKINGLPIMQSSQIPANVVYSGTTGLTYLIYGNFEMLVVGFFGDGLDVIFDPFTQSTGAGDLAITFMLDMDTNLLQPNAFSVCPNMA